MSALDPTAPSALADPGLVLPPKKSELPLEWPLQKDD
jgi:hypothetical protein